MSVIYEATLYYGFPIEGKNIAIVRDKPSDHVIFKIREHCVGVHYTSLHHSLEEEGVPQFFVGIIVARAAYHHLQVVFPDEAWMAGRLWEFCATHSLVTAGARPAFHLILRDS